MSERNILGIDPGLAKVGYGVIEPGDRPRNFRMLDSGIIRTDSDRPKPVRLRKIYLEINDLVEDYDPESVAVEEVYFSSNKKTANMVSEARGVVLLAGASRQIESFSPLQVKKTITGHGKSKKKQVKMMVKRLLDVEELPKAKDAADALGIALCQGLSTHSAVHRQMSEDKRS